MKSRLRNQKGLALITTLIMMVLALGVVAILLALTTRATKLTGLQQGYTTALGAAKAAPTLFINTVENCSPTHVCATPPFTTNEDQSCLDSKLFNTTSTWQNCSTNDQTTDPTQDPDIEVVLGKYTVYMKVINTYLSLPNPDGSPCAYGCYYYTVVATAVNPENHQDTAQTQFTYRYDK